MPLIVSRGNQLELTKQRATCKNMLDLEVVKNSVRNQLWSPIEGSRKTKTYLFMTYAREKRRLLVHGTLTMQCNFCCGGVGRLLIDVRDSWSRSVAVGPRSVGLPISNVKHNYPLPYHRSFSRASLTSPLLDKDRDQSEMI